MRSALTSACSVRMSSLVVSGIAHSFGESGAMYRPCTGIGNDNGEGA